MVHSPSLVLIVLVAVLVGTGVYLMLERSLSRIVLGLALLANGVNIAILVAGGRAGQPPLVGQSEAAEMSDPLAQALILTAIVITLGTTAFMLALAYRSWQLDGNDEVQDDLEDRRVAAMAEADERVGQEDAVVSDDEKIDSRDEVFDEEDEQ